MTTAQYDWTMAPSWANYAAVNEDGSANWFAEQPVIDESRGRWTMTYSERRNWPMFSVVRLFRCWRESLQARPGDGTNPPPVPQPGSCLAPGDVVVSDAISYIQVGLGNMQMVPDCYLSS